MKMNYLIYTGAILLCMMPFIDTPLALLTGIILAQTLRNPFVAYSKKIIHILLQASVVGLGFGMNAIQAAQAGKTGLLFTIISIATTLVLGLILGKRLKMEKDTTYLISAGTAICGGSAIAAISSILRSNEKSISTALGTVFILNSIALFLFPWIGHILNLSEHQFGVWAAIAIHDTSSVVGAASKYGAEALQTATTIKLERALWIIPLSVLSIYLFSGKSGKIKIPYFIPLFVLAMLVNTYIPGIHNASGVIVLISKTGLKITLFLIGAGLNRELITSVGIRPMIHGVSLWLFISLVSLVVIMNTLI